MCACEGTLTRDKRASCTFSLLIIDLFEGEVRLGVRDGGGLGGGKGWSRGVLSWRDKFREPWRAAEDWAADVIGGNNNDDEEEDEKNVEGFKRLGTWLRILFEWEASWTKAGMDEAE